MMPCSTQLLAIMATASAMIAGLIRNEFWRAFPNGTDVVEPDEGAQIKS